MIELKPCPFCGGKMQLLGKDPVKIGIVMDCTECYIRVAVPWAYDAEHGIPAFNKRAFGWIPCSERLPEVDSDGWSDDVLILMRRFDGPHREGEYFETFVGYYATDAGWYTMMHNNCHPVGVEKLPPYTRDGRVRRTTDKVTHWMPLPELPEKEEHHES